MANINTPLGFKPNRSADGRDFNEATNTYPIASGYGTSIFVGDAVKLVSGKIQKAAPGDQIVGVAAGFKWIQASGLPSYAFFSYWPAGTATFAGQDGEVLVIDDPNLMFEAVFTNSTSVPSQADVGSFFNHIDVGGNPSSGLSGEGIDYTTKTATAASGVWRFVGFVARPDNDKTSAYSRGLFVPTKHNLRANSGAA